MMLTIPDVLSTEELNSVVSSLDASDFVDGKTTAGWHAKLVKQNTQLKNEANYSQELKETIKNALRRNPLFQIAVQPRLIHSMLFSRYESSMSYGSHIDNALMGGQEFWRSDVSLTLFLSSPSSYGGGELVIEGVEGETTFKLEAGSAVVYPSSTLHRVNPVTEGVRLVAVAWVQSLVRDPHKREILFDLDVARRALFEKQGKTTEFDLISKSHANLLRQWADA
ncbi:Fe2+-dependent dioxygenase [Trichocoleus sp. FACHB-591]|uniref:Fe2+-dependent dioxygenase n=1 Tax=Trichocoleus sp. FACHB-591 TaxID=2692872 RepID=UPI0016841405|nr:Fe2+-dependent dioxygenase [Trichocoleus sp. FACHB-591]MBD2098449.1 Fe2+-dependent dioxygenase [Trichocoleus sp. FACHB-591]